MDQPHTVAPASPTWWRNPFLLLALTVIFWAGNIIVGRASSDLLPPAALSFWRWVCALLVILPFTWRRVWAQRALIIGHWWILLLLSVLSITLFTLLFYRGLASTTAINAAAVNTMLPIMIMLVAWMAGERATAGQWIGVALALAGVLVVITRGSLQILLALEFNSGDLWVLASGLSWALYTVLIRHRRPPLDGLVMLTVCAALGCLLLLPFWLAELARGNPPVWQAGSILAVLYVGIFPSLLSHSFWNQGVVSVGPNAAGVFLHLVPILTILLAWLFLGELLRSYHVVGLGLSFGGVVLSTRMRR
ncbi:MAG: DMT family transporter [Gammaproteobacteria bacterium]|nr:DMT family transporter [Gammaproteobacteria bacterium]